MGGEIVFNDDTIELNQGDMLVYNGKLHRNYSDVTSGVKYVLVLYIHINSFLIHLKLYHQ
jgi:hypothetical protein